MSCRGFGRNLRSALLRPFPRDGDPPPRRRCSLLIAVVVVVGEVPSFLPIWRGCGHPAVPRCAWKVRIRGFLNPPGPGVVPPSSAPENEEVVRMAMSIKRRSRAAIDFPGDRRGLRIGPRGFGLGSRSRHHPAALRRYRQRRRRPDGLTRASASNGGPISGLIPNTVGNAPLGAGQDGGFDTPACPAG
jgi:hypothetical protein